MTVPAHSCRQVTSLIAAIAARIADFRCKRKTSVMCEFTDCGRSTNSLRPPERRLSALRDAGILQVGRERHFMH